MEWSFAAFLICTAGVTLGALLQAATGLGAGLIVVPWLALVSYHLVPGPVIMASLVLSTMMTMRGRRHIDYAGVPLLLTGLFAGSAVAVLLLIQLPFERLGVVFGGFVLVAVGLSLRAPEIRATRTGLLGVGTLAGAMGTAAGIGAPVLALLYQHRSGPELRATLALLYLVSSLLMLGLLHFGGRFGMDEAVSGIYLAPGFILGYLLSPRLARLIDGGYTRPAVLVIATLSALVLIVRGMTTA